jgi:hypothetical protein
MPVNPRPSHASCARFFKGWAESPTYEDAKRLGSLRESALLKLVIVGDAQMATDGAKAVGIARILHRYANYLAQLAEVLGSVLSGAVDSSQPFRLRRASDLDVRSRQDSVPVSRMWATNPAGYHQGQTSSGDCLNGTQRRTGQA